jgi:integrase
VSVRKRPDGPGYMVDKFVSGKRLRRTVSTQREAERIEAIFERADREGGYIVLLSDTLREHAAHLRVMRKARSADSAEYHGAVLLAHFGPDFNVATMTPQHVARFVEARRAATAPSVSTINGHLRILRAAVNFAVECGRLRKAPTVKLLKEGRRLPTKLSQAEVDRLVRSAKDPLVALALLLAAHAGLRHQEILHLRVSDVDLDARTISVTAKPEAGWSPKAHHERVIPLSNRLADALKPHVSLRSSMAWLFPGVEKGMPRTSLYEPIREVFQACGLWDRSKKSGLHMLRRTFASAMLKKADLQTVKELGGWSSISVLERYTVSDDETRTAAIASVFDEEEGSASPRG